MPLTKPYSHTINRRAFLLGALSLIACSPKLQQHSPLNSGSLVIALGDSLTAGYGAQNTPYPKALSELTHWQIINSGISGNTTADVLARLPETLQNTPKLILLSIGGNDFLRKIPLSQTRHNLSQIIQQIQQQKIPQVLIAQPQVNISAALFSRLSDHPLYQELAKEHNIPLFSHAWSEILSDKTLRSDTIHANDQGYRLFAEKLSQYLKKIGFLN